MKIRAIIVSALITCGIVSTIFYVKANQASTNEKAITEDHPNEKYSIVDPVTYYPDEKPAGERYRHIS